MKAGVEAEAAPLDAAEDRVGLPRQSSAAIRAPSVIAGAICPRLSHLHGRRSRRLRAENNTNLFDYHMPTAEKPDF
jgi:hypothetical protein